MIFDNSNDTAFRRMTFGMERKVFIYSNEVEMLRHGIVMAQNGYTMHVIAQGKWDMKGFGEWRYRVEYTKTYENTGG